MGLRQIGAQLQGHPDMHRTPGVEVSTGSLGQGLSMCLGIALALRLDGLDETAQVFGVLSDGDCQEGQTWEAATAAAALRRPQHHRDRRLQPPADRRHHRGGHGHRRRARQVRGLRLGHGRDRRPRHGRRWWRRSSAAGRCDRPAAIVAQTTKGKGVSTMEGRFGFHGKAAVSPEFAAEALEELERAASRSRPGRCRRRGTTDRCRPRPRPSRPRPERPTATRSPTSARSTRTSSPSTPTSPARPRRSSSARRFPERFFNVGAAEANMMSMACGLAATGKVPYCSTFAIFASGRAYDQVRLGHRPQRAEGADRRLPRRRLAGRGRRLAPDDRGHRADAGDAADAASSCPADYNQAYRATARVVRARRADVHALRPAGDADRLRGDPRDARRRGRRRCARARTSRLIATGHMVWRAMEAAESLEAEDGVEAEVLNVSIIKPLALRDDPGVARRRRAWRSRPRSTASPAASPTPSAQVAAEQHPVPIFAVGMGDEFGLSGTGEACMEHFGLTARGHRRPRPRGAGPEADRLAPAALRP